MEDPQLRLRIQLFYVLTYARYCYASGTVCSKRRTKNTLTHLTIGNTYENNQYNNNDGSTNSIIMLFGRSHQGC